MPKNEHAVALGRLGGKKSSPAKQASCQRNATKPRQKRYRLIDGELCKRVEGGWSPLSPPYDRLARLWLRRNR